MLLKHNLARMEPVFLTYTMCHQNKEQGTQLTDSQS